jgi:uncharacterized membrane protein YgdD (TMEM256/DUF423 family)
MPESGCVSSMVRRRNSTVPVLAMVTVAGTVLFGGRLFLLPKETRTWRPGPTAA